MRYATLRSGESRSFPEGDPFLAGAAAPGEADVLIHLGTPPWPVRDMPAAARLVELGTECLRQHVDGDGPADLLGFARYRNGDDPPSKLIELVRLPHTAPAAIAAARAVFTEAGFVVAVSSDQPGRIVDRLVRPVYNAALRFLDEGLATREDMDATCRLGLGYPDGPIERVTRGGLAWHHEVSRSLFEAFGTPAFAPAPAAIVAARRRRP